MLRKISAVVIAFASLLGFAVTGLFALAMFFFANADEWMFSDINLAGAVGIYEYLMLALWFGGSVVLAWAARAVWLGERIGPREMPTLEAA